MPAAGHGSNLIIVRRQGFWVDRTLAKKKSHQNLIDQLQVAYY
jgi:hypothetical protein